jgi:antirestriction protein ArdC
MSEIYAKVTANILKALESGESLPWRKPWSVPCPANSNGRRYSGVNRVVLSSTDYRDHRCITFNQARSLGGCVRKGEKGTPVVLWKQLSFLDQEEQKPESKLVCQNFTVFNLEQCDGVEISDLEPRQVTDATISEKVNSVLREFATCPPIKYGGDRAFYSPTKDEIRMPHTHHFISDESWASVLLHELGHSCGHPARLNRFSIENSKRDDRIGYAFEELVAELTSAMLCAELGIVGNADQSAAYIQSWIKGFRHKPFFLAQASRRAEKSAAVILGRSS